MKRKRICAWFITVAMLLTMLPSAFAVSFADTRGHWAEDSINRWSDRGVTRGARMTVRAVTKVGVSDPAE